ncbi:MAG: hypothetical protein DRJ60_03425 [Thermoprotei archaeon]|nr:MAG: hypothetical protein DRJ60_03425 [Thermoprotei archaeon]
MRFRLRDPKGNLVEIPSFLTPPRIEKLPNWDKMVGKMPLHSYLREVKRELELIRAAYKEKAPITEEEYCRMFATSIMNYVLLIMARTYASFVKQQEREKYARENKEIAEELKKVCRNAKSKEDLKKIIDFIKKHRLIPYYLV